MSGLNGQIKKMLHYKRDNRKRVLNTRRQEKFKFQASKDDGEKAL